MLTDIHAHHAYPMQIAPPPATNASSCLSSVKRPGNLCGTLGMRHDLVVLNPGKRGLLHYLPSWSGSGPARHHLPTSRCLGSARAEDERRDALDWSLPLERAGHVVRVHPRMNCLQCINCGLESCGETPRFFDRATCLRAGGAQNGNRNRPQKCAPEA